MSSNTMNLVLLPRGRPLPKLPEEATVERSATTSEIYHRIAAETGTSIHRIRVTKGSDGQFIPNSKQTPISSTGLLDGSRIYVKDLGMIPVLPPLVLML